MANKKAQGLPLSFIVIAAISALILVLIIAFVIGGFSPLAIQFNQAKATPLEIAKSNCQIECNKLQLVDSTADWTSSKYCGLQYNIDRDGDKQIETGAEAKQGDEEALRCWDGPISEGCSASFTTATGNTTLCKSTGSGDDCFCPTGAE